MIDVTPVILCGGSGTRLWPLSRTGFPKQFLSLTGSHTLFQMAAQRLQALATDSIRMQTTLIVTNEEHRFLALEQLREIGQKQAIFVLEPVARNTAPALTLAALQAQSAGSDPVLVACPSDQHIGDPSSFVVCLRRAIEVAAQNVVVILGIQPDRPETGYGYIQFEKIESSTGAYTVRQFVEKPDAEKAAQYLASSQYAWNSGMFVLKASIWLRALEQFRPDILHECEAAWRSRAIDQLVADYQFLRPDSELFYKVPAESIDYAVMEKCPGSAFDIQMLVLDARWSDLGAWDAVWQVGKPDEWGNVCRGDVLLDQAKGNFIHASSRLVSAVGVSNLVIVETPDAVLVADKSHCQNVKNIVAELAKSGRREQIVHRKVHRPWGWYDNIDEGGRFKVKRINVKPGASLSLQKHHHRAEHWIVVKGTAEVTCGDKVMTITENQSTYIPLGEIQRLSNPGRIDLEIIEVQSGSYLEEDDIVRLQDAYGRK